MRITNVFLFFSVVFSTVVFAKTDDEEIARLKSDFRQVNVVAQIHIEKLEIAEEIGAPRLTGGYTSYRFTGTVVESFKGKFKKGDRIVFYSFIEGQPYRSAADLMPGDKVRFLEFYKNESGLKNLSELENSGHRATTTNLAELRRLRRRR